MVSKKKIMKKLVVATLFTCLVNFSNAQASPLLAWGIPGEVCKQIGGDYDSLTELSEWNPLLKISTKTMQKLSGSVTSGALEILFNITGKKGVDSIYSLTSLSLKTKDNSFCILVSTTNFAQ